MFRPYQGLRESQEGRYISGTAQNRKLLRFQGTDLMFTDAAIKEIAGIALARATGARGLSIR